MLVIRSDSVHLRLFRAVGDQHGFAQIDQFLRIVRADVGQFALGNFLIAGYEIQLRALRVRSEFHAAADKLKHCPLPSRWPLYLQFDQIAEF